VLASSKNGVPFAPFLAHWNAVKARSAHTFPLRRVTWRGDITSPRRSVSPLPQSPDIPDHELLRRVGSGGPASVARTRRATTARSKSFVRLQKQPPRLNANSTAFKVRAVSRSPGLVDILQAGRHEDYFYYVMELADGTVMTKSKSKAQSEAKHHLSRAGPRAGLPGFHVLRHSSFHLCILAPCATT
jgi:hypothetical protein